MTTLSKRLQSVADLVTPGLCVADIGCDHGYLSIYLVESKIAKHVIALDINQGPLMRAQENIRMKGFADRIETRLSDGLKGLKKDDVDCLIMAGMGGRLMIQIMSACRATCESAKEIILQPQSEIIKVRHFLEDSNYLIISESMVYEDDKYYQMIKVIHGEMNLGKDVYYKYGKILLHEENPILHQFLIQENEYYDNLYKKMSVQKQTERVQKRLTEVDAEKKLIEEALLMISEKNPIEVVRIIC